METQFLFTSPSFSPTVGELDEEHDDFINLGLYALELADFIESQLTMSGYPVRFRCQEDWGHWMELEHKGKFTLAIGCGNSEGSFAGQPEHRVFLVPNMPVIRRFFRKIDVQRDVQKLSATLQRIFKENDIIANVRIEKAH